jgi:hypothetical protein
MVSLSVEVPIQPFSFAAPGWWWRSVAFGIALMVVFQRVFPDAMPWPGLPDRTRNVLMLFVGIVCAVAVHGLWWMLRRRRAT